jgi:hypothetical protein
MVTTYPIYILDLNHKDMVVFPEMKADIPHPEFWEKDVAAIIAKNFDISLKPLLNLPYCQRRARKPDTVMGSQATMLSRAVPHTPRTGSRIARQGIEPCLAFSKTAVQSPEAARFIKPARANHIRLPSVSVDPPGSVTNAESGWRAPLYYWNGLIDRQSSLYPGICV